MEPEEDEFELVKESHGIDAKLCDVKSSNCTRAFGSSPVGEASVSRHSACSAPRLSTVHAAADTGLEGGGGGRGRGWVWEA